MNDTRISTPSFSSLGSGASILKLDNLIVKYDQFRGQERSFRSINRIIQRIVQDESLSSTKQEKWDCILDVILKYALSAPYIYLKLTMDIFSNFSKDDSFQASLSKRLRIKIVECLYTSLTVDEDYELEHFGELDNTSKVRNFCKLIARILINDWSTENQFSTSNALTSLSISAVHTWLDVLSKFNENQTYDVEEERGHLETCCFCLIQIVNHSGRKLWLNWPDLVDRMYCIFKNSIVANNGLISEKMRERLLASYVLINEWCKSVKANESPQFSTSVSRLSSSSANYCRPLHESNRSTREKSVSQPRFCSRYFNNSGKVRQILKF